MAEDIFDATSMNEINALCCRLLWFRYFFGRRHFQGSAVHVV
jgi:hypothetical protein